LAKAGPSHIPAGIGAEWRLEDMRAEAADVVAVTVHRRCKCWILRNSRWRLDRDDSRDIVSVILRAAAIGEPRVEDPLRTRYAGDGWKFDTAARHQTAVLEQRKSTVGWRPPRRHPFFECNQKRSYIVGVRVRVRQLLAYPRRARKRRNRREPAMLGT